MATDLVLYSEADGLAWLTLNRPEALNALGPGMLADLPTARQRAQRAPTPSREVAS